MSTPISAAALLVIDGAAKYLARGLELAAALGLPVTTWRGGDPTRSLYKYLAEMIGTLEGNYGDYIKAGFLSTATGPWLRVLAWETFGVEVAEATYATPKVTVTNTGGGFYPIDEVGQLTFRASATGKTYRTTSLGTLSGGATLTFDLIADEPGSDSSVGVDEIDELVTTRLGVVINSSTAAVGTDEPTEDEIKAQCRASLGALSPNGPADAYEFVARNSALTGVTNVTRARATSSAANGTTTVYIASPSGGVDGPTVAAVQNAIEAWATPLCITPTVTSVTETNVDLTAEVTGEDIPAGWETIAESAVAAYFATLIGPTVVARSKIDAVIHAAVPQIDTITIVDPAANVPIALGAVPVLDDVSLSEE